MMSTTRNTLLAFAAAAFLASAPARAANAPLDAALQPGFTWLSGATDEKAVLEKIAEVRPSSPPAVQTYLDELTAIVKTRPKLSEKEAFSRMATAIEKLTDTLAKDASTDFDVQSKLVATRIALVTFEKQVGIETKERQEKALKAATGLVKAFPQASGAYVTLGRFLLDDKDNAGAAKVAQQCLDVIKNDAACADLRITALDLPRRAYCTSMIASKQLSFRIGTQSVLAPQDIKRIEESGDPDQPFTFNVVLTPVGAEKFAQATAANVGRDMGIFLGESLQVAPRIMSKIAGGRATLSAPGMKLADICAKVEQP